MKKIFLLITAIVSFSLISLNAQQKTVELNLMPMPKQINLLDGKFRIDSTFSLYADASISKRVQEYSNRVLDRLINRTGIFLINPVLKSDNYPLNNFAELSSNTQGELKLNEDESYSLKISENKISLKGKTDFGVMRGLETLLQLFSADESGYYFPTLEIKDEPRFPWRGLMIDVSRHFMPMNIIKRNIDGMAAVKMNVLHLHLSDDQGFRVECKSLPKLHRLASEGNYFTHEEIKDLIEFAENRGIRIVPEFDIPGHSTSWLTAYPELASAPGPYELEKKWGIFDPTFDPTNEETYKFFEKFFGEMAALFKDEYMHIGGDENEGRHWDANSNIQKFMKENGFKDNHELQSYFNKGILKILTDNNKIMVGWDEILQPEMPKNIVIQSWRGKKSLIESAKKGYQGILSNGYYIDLMQFTDFHYLNDPLENTNLSEAEEQKILGGEATMWSEMITPLTIDSRIWPRTAAIAERFWSPQNVNDVDDMYRRLESISFRLEELGLRHKSFQPVMLRRLTGNKDIESLKVLVDVIKPLEEYKRHIDSKRKGKIFGKHSPYSRVMDAAVADPKKARMFNNLVDEYLAASDSAKLKLIIDDLILWSGNHDKLLPIIKSSPILKEIEPLSQNLSKISDAALVILNSDDNKIEDVDLFKESVKNSKITYGQVKLIIIDSLEELILQKLKK
ncbi:MAG: family 20 glycosylhydrolase [Ignavibacteriae bacterium]|nr:beta-hexosaminidase [Ignavibacteriota bacterium]NOG96681.1 family 20 glycosylhydrolase [Ignavibacteriota bacterium]